MYHIKWQGEKGMARPFITCLANTEQNLYFYVNDPVKIVPAERVVGLIFGDDHLMIKVAFHPTGTFRLLNINMQQTVNTGLDATSFWGEEVRSVLKQLSSCSSYDDMIAIVCSFIETK